MIPLQPIRTVIVDTDIGDNIDDALALAYLLSAPTVKVAAVTTVGHAPAYRAGLARAVCRAYGQEVPVAAGYPVPSAPSAGPLSSVHDPEEAVALIAGILGNSSEDVSILAIGPLTNVARLLQRHPALSVELTVMGGAFGPRESTAERELETNMRLDPVAASAVFGSQWPIRVVGKDVSRRVTLSAERAREELVPCLPAPVDGWLESWLAAHGSVTLNDPTAAAAMLDSGLC